MSEGKGTPVVVESRRDPGDELDDDFPMLQARADALVARGCPVGNAMVAAALLELADAMTLAGDEGEDEGENGGAL